jgi:hypothetical protein
MPNARADSAEAAGAFSWLNCVRPLLAVNRPTAIAKGIAASLDTTVPACTIKP